MLSPYVLQRAIGIPTALFLGVALLLALYYRIFRRCAAASAPNPIVYPYQKLPLRETVIVKPRSLDSRVIPFQRLWRNFHPYFVRKIAASIIQHEWKKYVLRVYIFAQGTLNFTLYRYHYHANRIQTGFRRYYWRKQSEQKVKLQIQCRRISRAVRLLQTRWRFRLALKSKQQLIKSFVTSAMDVSMRRATFVRLCEQMQGISDRRSMYAAFNKLRDAETEPRGNILRHTQMVGMCYLQNKFASLQEAANQGRRRNCAALLIQSAWMYKKQEIDHETDEMVFPNPWNLLQHNASVALRSAGMSWFCDKLYEEVRECFYRTRKAKSYKARLLAVQSLPHKRRRLSRRRSLCEDPGRASSPIMA